jgi:flavin-dependent dehydrogenase
VRAVRRRNLVLLGDAAGYLDAITGEGLALAFHQAEALVAAAAGGDLGRYASAHRRLHRLPDAMTAVLLAVERRPRLRRRMIHALAAEPALFSRLLGVHARSLPWSDFGMRGAMRLAWGLARG